ncbi:hypothetical protein [Paenibacillus sp. LC231]|uniref:hypothetical protein n=1 Tax=Paenibacillus sp. LC231 TaxID=1120679 RepID=UPI000A4801A8|nr:hypothetical protein [Paenibacillus sp. LC231]
MSSGGKKAMDMRIIHTMPLFIRESSREHDLDMASLALGSLQRSQDHVTVLFNQGCLTNEELHGWLQTQGISAMIRGNGTNIGIAAARQACFEFIWEHFPQIEYLSEIHVDMIFPPNWYAPLLRYLERTDEPMVSPGIVTSSGELQPLGAYILLPDTPEGICETLQQLPREGTADGFVHPVVHRADILREIGGYDPRFLSGKQGYEDDSLLLGMRYYMGTRTKWRPKCCLESWVYHATMAQRMSLPDKYIDFSKNENGLFHQYGAYGLRELADIHHGSEGFLQLFRKFTPDHKGVSE